MLLELAWAVNESLDRGRASKTVLLRGSLSEGILQRWCAAFRGGRGD